MSRRVIRYPSGRTLAVLPDTSSADAAVAELQSVGVATHDTVLLAGTHAATRLERLGEMARARRASAGRPADAALSLRMIGHA